MIMRIGNGGDQGFETIARAAAEMARGDKLRPCYELSHEYSDRMPLSPFADAISLSYRPTHFIAGHAGNGETVSGQFGSQGTKIDALGHFGYLEDGEVRYFGGLTQREVKPSDQSPLLRLGTDEIPPIVTSAVLLDAKRLRGRSLSAGEQVTAEDLEAMLAAQRVRGLLAGDALLIHTGWGEKWAADNPEPARTEYYGAGPGLSREAAEYIAARDVVCIGMDVPFIDAVRTGYLRGTEGPPADAPADLPFVIHHQNLTQAGIYQVHNMHLGELAADEVYLSAVFILPLRIRGGSNSPVRPVAIGGPHRSPPG
ncbi:cyclase family protein [Pseudonocardia eucalypti]|uniref:Cyclase family protein n=2 Tax=Pseudonocardia eucalypti TaxID=648755 RepID=A0ABP9QH34_9PSEU